MRKETSEGSSPESESGKLRLENAKAIFRDFLTIAPGEKVLLLTDTDPQSTDRELIETFKAQLTNQGTEFTELAANKKTTTEEVADLFKDHSVVWASCDWASTGIDFYALVDKLESSGARMADSGGVEASALDEDGALAERLDVMEMRLDKMETRLREVCGFHIRTSYGTDLKVKLRPLGERKWEKDPGIIYAGSWDNVPGGEIYTTPDEERVEGTLVLPVLQDEVVREQGVDALVHLTIRGGKIARIDGGESAEKLRKYLESWSKSQDDPESVVQCAEIAFGANAKARSSVRDPKGSYADPKVSVLEAEKRLGTMHLAFGSSKHGEPGTEGHTESDVHLDFVIPRAGLSVTAFKSENDFSRGKNGERLIDEGRWLFI